MSDEKQDENPPCEREPGFVLGNVEMDSTEFLLIRLQAMWKRWPHLPHARDKKKNKILERIGDWNEAKERREQSTYGSTPCDKKCLEEWRNHLNTGSTLFGPSVDPILPGFYLGNAIAAASRWVQDQEIVLRVRLREFSAMTPSELSKARYLAQGVRDLLVDVEDSSDAATELFSLMPEIWATLDDAYGARRIQPLWPFYPFWSSAVACVVGGPWQIPKAINDPVVAIANRATLRRLTKIRNENRVCRFTAKEIDAERQKLDHGAPKDNMEDVPTSSCNINNSRHGHVLVHCAAGLSRSATVVISWLMRRYQWNVQLAMAFVRSCRPIIHPNSSFMDYLRLQHIMMQVVQRWTWSHLARLVERAIDPCDISSSAFSRVSELKKGLKSSSHALEHYPFGKLVVSYVHPHPNNTTRTAHLAKLFD